MSSQKYLHSHYRVHLLVWHRAVFFCLIKVIPVATLSIQERRISFKDLMLTYKLSLRPSGKMNEGITNPLQMTTQTCWLHVWFSSISLHLVETGQANGWTVNSPLDHFRIILIKLKAMHVHLVRILEFIENFAKQSFFLYFMFCENNRPFLILYEKYQISSFTNCQIRNQDTPKSLGSLSSLIRTRPTNSRVLLSERSNWNFQHDVLLSSPLDSYNAYQIFYPVLRLTWGVSSWCNG